MVVSSYQHHHSTATMVASRTSLVLLLCSILATRNDALQFLPIVLSSSVTTQAPPPPSTTNTKRTTSTTAAVIEETQQKMEQEARRAHRRNPFNALFVDLPESPLPQPCVVPPMDNPYFADLASQLPTDFPPGAFLRIGPNGAAPDEGFLDGDGFINCITFPPPPPPPNDDNNEPKEQQQQSASLFTATYVDTLGRQTERKVAAARRSNNNNKNNKNDEKSASAPPPPRYRGTLGGAPRGWPLLRTLVRNAVALRARPQKDTCNTALAFHGGALLALMEQTRPTVLAAHRDGRVTTVRAFANLDGALPTGDPVTGGSLAAHGRTCPLTGERIHVSYSSGAPPHARVDIFAAPPPPRPNGDSRAAGAAGGFQLKRSIPVHDLDVPVMIHDLAITENYVVVLDFPLTIRPGRMIRDQFPVAFEPDHGARIGLVPRDENNNNSNAEIRWFEVDPCVVLHTVNAYEDKDNNKVILQALRSVPKTTSSYITSYTTAFLHEWELDLDDSAGTAVVREQCLNPSELVEFPAIDDRHHGQSSADYAYCIHVSSIGGPIATLSTPREGILIDGLVKFALRDSVRQGEQKGDVVDRFVLPDQWYAVSEPTVVPKMGKRNNKDDAGAGGVYVVMVATHVPEAAAPDLERIRNGKTLTSHVLVLDGDQLSAGPVWAAETPQHIAYGLHSEFIPWDQLRE